MTKLELFKPLIISKNKLLNPSLFDAVGISYRHYSGWYLHLLNLEFRIFIIFYDEQNNTYWYIKSKYIEKDEIKKKEKGEILIEEFNIDLSIKKLSYINCSEILRIDADLLESLVDKYSDLDNRTPILNKEKKQLILDKINDSFKEDPSYLSIIEVYKMGDKLKGRGLYICPEKYKQLCDWANLCDWNNWHKIQLFNAESIDDNSYGYYKAFNFMKKFQKEYFPA